MLLKLDVCNPSCTVNRRAFCAVASDARIIKTDISNTRHEKYNAESRLQEVVWYVIFIWWFEFVYRPLSAYRFDK